MTEITRAAFKAYDIRGRVPDELNEEMAYRIGRIFPGLFQAKKVAVGRDIRLSGPALRDALVKGLTEAGADVVDIGVCGTEQIYFTTAYLKLAGGIMITASHNPKDYNGMKLVRAESRPISGDTGLRDLEDMTAVFDEARHKRAPAPGQVVFQDTSDAYIEHILRFIDVRALKPLKIVANSGNGCAGPILEKLAKRLPFEFVPMNFQPDGTFPHGVPNPILKENQTTTAALVRQAGADLGIAWDGDFDRCFFFDADGNFIEGYYIVGFLAHAFLSKVRGAKIIHDPRLTWNTIDIVAKAGGVPIQNKTGHAFIKERMRREDAVYGGEMSAHHYFRDFFYCDSGMLPWLLVTEVMCKSGRSLAQLVAERMALYPASGEINREVAEPSKVVTAVEKAYGGAALSIDRTDGVSLEYPEWRFNLRMSNTEPVIRLNVESRHNPALMQEKTREILQLIDSISS